MANTSLLDGQLNLGTSTTLVGSKGNFYKASVGDGNKFLIKSDLFNLVYPVGSIYMSVDNTSPASFLGGTWERIKDRFLLGSGDSYSNGATGGESSHTLTVAEMPSHNHSASSNSTGSHSHSATAFGATRYEAIGHIFSWDTYGPILSWDSGAPSWQNASNKLSIASNGDHSHTITVNNNGSGNAHNNMPPYLAVCMWKRIA